MLPIPTMLYLSRSQDKTIFPATGTFIASQNPCQCGYLGDKSYMYRDSALQISPYKKKISGPLFDRSTIHLAVPAVTFEILPEQAMNNVENSTTVRSRAVPKRLKGVL